MRTLEDIRGIFADLVSSIASWQGDANFTCGDCDRWRQCGLPPSDKCVVRAAQIARDGGTPRKRGIFIGSDAVWMYDR